MKSPPQAPQRNALQRQGRVALSAAGLLSVLIGCGGEEEDAALPEGTPGDLPLYLVQTRTFSADTTLGYLTPTHSLEEDLDYSNALEQPGGGVLYADRSTGTFLVGSGEDPVITRYEIDENDNLIAGDSLSFFNEGVVFLYAGSVIFVSPEQAYYMDLDQLQAIRFNPTAMEIEGTVSLAGAEREGFFTSFGDPVVRDGSIYFPGQWYTEPDWDRVPSGSMLIRLDTETDEVTLTSDPRCTSMLASLTTDSGDVYWFSDMFNAIARRGYGPQNGVPDCALRLRRGETRFDPDWQLDTGALVGGAPAIAVLQGSNSKMWFRVLQEGAVELPTPADYQTLDTAPAWQWYLLDVESDAAAVRNDDRPLSSVGALGMYVDGRAFTTIENEDYSETKLLELTADGFIERGSALGVIDEIARVK